MIGEMDDKVSVSGENLRQSVGRRKLSLDVTVVIPTRNEERNLARCLAALTRFSKVIVVDSGSTDATPAIAKEFGAQLLQFTWDGTYPKKRNWVLLTFRFATEWVLFLDADEVVNDAFCDEIQRAIAKNNHNGYWLNYTNYFQGKRLQYGLTQRKLALFKIGCGLYEQIQEQSWTTLDMEVHEHPIVEGSVGDIRQAIEHNDFQGLAKFVERHRDYAVWEAQRWLLLKKEAATSAERLTRRQKFKYQNLHHWWYPWFYFIYTYLIKRGFLDGTHGFHYAFYKLWYFVTIRLMITELGKDVSYKL
jgi:glycosyltransferase involved in cell wall biosynthesis